MRASISPTCASSPGRAEARTRIGWFRSVDNIAHAFSIQYPEIAHELARPFLLELIGPARIVDLSKQGHHAVLEQR